MPLTPETLAIPVVKGLDLNTAARLVQPPSLLQAQNASFSQAGSRKRYGHVASRLLHGDYGLGLTAPEVLSATELTLTPYGQKILSRAWLFGWGLITGGGGDSPIDIEGSNVDTRGLSTWAEPGHTFSGANRDAEILAWTGHTLHSLAPGQAGATPPQGLVNPAVMPHLRSSAIAKSNTASANQYLPDAADNGRIRVVAWIDRTNDCVRYTIFDSVTLAPLVVDETLTLDNIPVDFRVISLGSWVHILGFGDMNVGKMVSIFDQTPTQVVTRSLGEMYTLDVTKLNESLMVMVKTTSEATDNIVIRWFGEDGNDAIGRENGNLDLSGAGSEAAVNAVVTIHPVAETVAVVWIEPGPTGKIWGSTYDGATLNGHAALRTMTAPETLKTFAVAPKWNVATNDSILFDAYITISSSTRYEIIRCRFHDSTLDDTRQKWHLRVATQAFRAGDRTFVWVGKPHDLQPAWVLLDEELNPVGKFAYAQANEAAEPGGESVIRSVNFRVFPRDGNLGQKDALVFHGAFSYKLRTPVDDEQDAVFTEPGILFAELDFLPETHSAQAGRCTYFPGAQLWCYDGARLTEAGFHFAPEFTLAAQSGGSLTADQTYTYRVDLCHRNAQNEEVRSASFIASQAITGANRTVRLTIKSALTCRPDSYFLIFRNSIQAGVPTTTLNLINSRDPTSPDYLANEQTGQQFTYNDTGAVDDTESPNLETHPTNAGTSYLQPFSAPACEIVSAGRDRLWVAGGELGPGQVAPSRLFDPGEVPGFNATLWRQVDRSNEPVTALGFVGDVTLMFRRRSTYLMEGDGPDNVATGFWAPPRLAYTDVGSVGQRTLVLISAGLLFQSEAGFRLITPGGGLQAVGVPVDPAAAGFQVSGAIVVGEDQEVRWYGPTGAMVYSYLNDCWSTWTCGAGGVARAANGRAVLLHGSDFWTETVGTYSDAGSNYEHRIQFPWLHPGNLGDFHRVRRFSGMGYWDPAFPHSVRVEIAYDEREFSEEFWEWDVPDLTQNTDTWGSGSWGDGVWGDALNTGLSVGPLRDSVWRWRRRPHRQKCSVFSIVVSDLASAGPGFTLVALGLELAKKPGLDRTAGTTTTNVTR